MSKEGHTHDEHDHHHDHKNLAENTLNWAIVANVLLTILQIAGGLISGSLSLVADAVHNLSDAAALAVAAFAIKIGKKPADVHKTFGYKRAETIAGLINFVALVTIGIFLCFEAMGRFMEPEPIAGIMVMWIAGVAIVIDLVTAFLIMRSAKDSMNMKAALIHNIADAAGSVAVLISGLLIYLYNWIWIDATLTVLIAIYVIAHGLHGLPQAIHLLMDGLPKNVSQPDVIKDIESVPGVLNTHHVHIWQIDEWRNALEAHVIVKDLTKIEEIKLQIKQALANNHKITHSTLEFEDGNNKDNFLDPCAVDHTDCHVHPEV